MKAMVHNMHMLYSLLWHALVLPIVDGSSAILRILAANCASNRTGRSKNFKNSALESLGVGARPNDAGHIVHVVPADVAIVRNVLHLLAITWGLLECLDEQCCGRGNNLNCNLAVLHVQLASHAHALPLLGGLAQVFSHRLGGQLHWAHFGSEGRHRRHLSSGHTHDDSLDLVRIELGHCRFVLLVWDPM